MGWTDVQTQSKTQQNYTHAAYVLLRLTLLTVTEVDFFHQKTKPEVLIITFLGNSDFFPVRPDTHIIYFFSAMITKKVFRVKKNIELHQWCLLALSNIYWG